MKQTKYPESTTVVKKFILNFTFLSDSIRCRLCRYGMPIEGNKYGKHCCHNDFAPIYLLWNIVFANHNLYQGRNRKWMGQQRWWISDDVLAWLPVVRQWVITYSHCVLQPSDSVRRKWINVLGRISLAETRDHVPLRNGCAKYDEK